MSVQRVTSSVEAKPCLANASPSVLCRRSVSGRGYDLAGLFTARGSVTSVGMTVAATTEPRKRAGSQPVRPRRPADLLAWYDRHRRALPWRAAPGETRRSLSRLALRDHAAADHREGGRALFRALPRALAGRAGARRGAARRRAAGCGPGSATTRAPATCTPAPRRWPSAMADISRTSEAELAALPGIGPYTAAAIAAIAFDAARRAGRRQCRAGGGAAVRGRGRAAGRQGRQSAASPRRWCRPSAPAISPRR